MMNKSINTQLWNMYINSEALEEQYEKSAEFCKKMGDENSYRHFKEIAKIYKIKKEQFLHFYKATK